MLNRCDGVFFQLLKHAKDKNDSKGPVYLEQKYNNGSKGSVFLEQKFALNTFGHQNGLNIHIR